MLAYLQGLKPRSLRLRFYVNRSDDAASVLSLASSCSCLKALLKDNRVSYASRDRGVLVVTLGEGHQGTQEGTVHLRTMEGNQEILYSITCIFRLPEVIKLSSAVLRWGLGDGLEEKALSFISSDRDGWMLESVVMDTDRFTYTVRENCVFLTPVSTKEPSRGIITVKIRLPGSEGCVVVNAKLKIE